MKKTISLIALGFLISLFSCDFSKYVMPETVTLQGDPVFEFPLGSKISNLEDMGFNIDEILDDVTADMEGMERTTVDIAGESVHALSLDQDFVDINLGDFTGDIGITEITQTIDEQTVSIPALTIDGVDISENIAPISLPDSVTMPENLNINVPSEGGGLSLTSDVTLPSSIVAGGFSEIIFDTGNLSVDVSILDGSSGLTVSINSASIISATDSTVYATATSGTGDITNGSTLVFDLDGVTFPNEFNITFNITIDGGDLTDFDISITNFTFGDTTTFSGATGIDFSQIISSPISMPLGDLGDLQSATIGDGSVVVDFNLPAEWAGITTTINITIIDSEGTAFIGGQSGTTSTVSLAGFKIDSTSTELSVDYSVSIVGSNANFSIDPDADEVTGAAVTTISKLSTLEYYTTALDFAPEPVSQDISDLVGLVSSVSFDSPELVMSFTNQLPFGIDIIIDSPDLGINSQTYSFGESITPTSYTVNLPALMDFANDPNFADETIDIAFSVDIDAYNADTNILTLTDITPGVEYSISGEVSATLEPSAVSLVDSADSSFSGTFPEAGGDPMDLSMLGDYLPEGIVFDQITASMNLVLPTGTNLNMTVKAVWDGGASEIYLLGSAGTPEVIIGAGSATEAVDISDSLKTVLNAMPADLGFEYDVSVSSDTTIDLSDADGKKISAGISLIFPLAFNVAEVIGEDGVEFTDENGDPLVPIIDEDVFGRDGTDPEADADMEEFIRMAKSISITADIENSLGLSMIIKVVHSDPPSGFTFEPIVLELDSNLTIELTAEQIECIAAGPFLPEIKLIIPSGDHALLADAGDLSITNLMIRLETDINYTIDLNEENK